MRCVASLTRVKKLKDEKANGGEDETADLFWATKGYEALKKISKIANAGELEQLTY